MNGRLLFVSGALAIVSTAYNARAQASDYFSGLYVGLEGGTASYNTRITFDGIDDPAGRGGAVYGAFLGYNYTYEKWLVGAEVVVNAASVPEPYTFNPGVVGFATLDLRRGISAGLDVRAGYFVTTRILLYTSVGYSANKQSVRIDGVPLEQFVGGAAAEEFGAVQFGAGLEAAVQPQLGIRVSFRTLSGHDLSASDFGTISKDASLTRFDVEPRQRQFLAGLVFRF